jgi:hypothetical protein
MVVVAVHLLSLHKDIGLSTGWIKMSVQRETRQAQIGPPSSETGVFVTIVRECPQYISHVNSVNDVLLGATSAITFSNAIERCHERKDT